MFGLIFCAIVAVAVAAFYIYLIVMRAFNEQIWWVHPVCIGIVIVCAVIFCVFLEREYFVFSNLREMQDKKRSSACKEIKYRTPYKVKGVEERYNDYEWARYLLENKKEGGVSLITALAKGDFAPAQALYGYAILCGKYNFIKNEKLGLQWLKLAEEKNCPLAFTCLYQAYKNGIGVKKNEKKAAGYLETALKINSPIPEAWIAKGYAYFNEGDKKNAKKCFEKAYQINPNYGMENLCDLTMSEKLLPSEIYGVIENLKKAVTTNGVLNLFGYAYEWNNDYKKASRYFLASAEQGDADAQRRIADYYTYGYLPTDLKKAEKLLLTLAEKEDWEACKKLGKLYTLDGFEDYEKAEKYYLLAAETGNEEYIYQLGCFYEMEVNDYKKAKNTYKKAAELNHAKAQGRYGERLWLEGKNKQALEWIEKGAAQGDDEIQFLLGKYYSENNQPKKAFDSFMLSAEQGNDMAQYRVADAYLRGDGVEQSDKKCAEWMIKSAEQGWFEAMVRLSVMYEMGIGVTKDLTKAAYWKAKIEEVFPE